MFFIAVRVKISGIYFVYIIVSGNVCTEIPPVVEANLNTPVKEKSKSPNSLNINLATSETNIIISSHTASDGCCHRVLVGVGLRSNAAIEVQQNIIYSANS